MSALWDLLANPYFQAPAIPLLLLLLKPLVKKLIRGPEKPIVWDDFYLGVDFIYGALSSTVVYTGYLWRRRAAGTSNTPTDLQLLNCTVFLVVIFALLIVVLSLHQEFEPRTTGGYSEKARRIWLGGVANLLGASMLVAFVLLVQGVL